MTTERAAPKPRRTPAVAIHPTVTARTRRAPAWAISIWVLGAVTYAVLFVIAIQQADNELLHGLDHCANPHRAHGTDGAENRAP